MRTFLLLIILFILAGCHKTQENSGLNPQVKHGKIYHCGASSLYALCEKNGVNVSLAECIKLLPMDKAGNSMLEYKGALESLGFYTHGAVLDVNDFMGLSVTAVILVGLEKNNFQIKEGPTNENHYLVIWPADEQSVEIIDYPRSSTMYKRTAWIDKCKKKGIKNFNSIVCSKDKKLIEQLIATN